MKGLMRNTSLQYRRRRLKGKENSSSVDIKVASRVGGREEYTRKYSGVEIRAAKYIFHSYFT